MNKLEDNIPPTPHSISSTPPSISPIFVRTYTALVNVLTACDDEVYWLIEAISKRIEKRHALSLSDDAEDFVDQRRLEALCGEQYFSSALRLFSAASANRKYTLPGSLYIALLHCTPSERQGSHSLVHSS
ncbi:hypothetical protein F5888DRAFT_1804430 [Russula emetica]|nr:hypothetical protein F5888DRAFT_1804430 [Russula emetica]